MIDAVVDEGTKKLVVATVQYWAGRLDGRIMKASAEFVIPR